MLWAGSSFFGGISRHREGVCGAVSAIGIYMGFLNRVPPGDKETTAKAKETARAKTFELVKAFKDEYGSIICEKLLETEGWSDEEIKKFFESKKNEKQCNDYVRFAVEKLRGLE